MDGVERARLERDHVRGLSWERDVADAQRPETERVAERDQLVGRDDAAGVGSYHARERPADHLLPRPAVRVLDEPRHHLGIEPGFENDALVLQLRAEGFRVEQVAVVRDGARAKAWVLKGKRMRVL